MIARQSVRSIGLSGNGMRKTIIIRPKLSLIEPVIPRILAYSVGCMFMSGIPRIALFINFGGSSAESFPSTGFRS